MQRSHKRENRIRLWMIVCDLVYDMVVMSIECREPSCAQSTLFNVHSATSTQHQGPESTIKSLGQKFQLILFTVKLSLNEFHWMVQPPRRNGCIMYYCDQEARFLDSNLTWFVHRVNHFLRYHKSIVDYNVHSRWHEYQ